MSKVKNLNGWERSSRNLDVPCRICASFWINANSIRRLPILRILDFGTPPIRQQGAVEHLSRVHGMGSSEFAGVGGVWLSGILSGLSIPEGTDGFTFEERARNEIGRRERLYRLTLDNMRMLHLWLRDTGLLTAASIRSAALNLCCHPEFTEGAAALGATMTEVTTTYAFRAACRSVVPP